MTVARSGGVAVSWYFGSGPTGICCCCGIVPGIVPGMVPGNVGVNIGGGFDHMGIVGMVVPGDPMTSPPICIGIGIVVPIGIPIGMLPIGMSKPGIMPP